MGNDVWPNDWDRFFGFLGRMCNNWSFCTRRCELVRLHDGRYFWRCCGAGGLSLRRGGGGHYISRN